MPCLNPLKNNEPTGVCEIGKPQSADCNKQNAGSSGSTGAAPTNIACPYTADRRREDVPVVW